MTGKKSDHPEQKVFPAKLKVLHRKIIFITHTLSIENALLSPESSENIVRMLINFEFIKHAFLERVISFVFHHAAFLEGVAFQLFLRSPMRSNLLYSKTVFSK